MADRKKQHFIPQSYLKAWCDQLTPSNQMPYIWQFSKDGNDVKKKAPKTIFYENDMYTVINPDGSRNLVFENLLGQLERQFSEIRKKLEQEKKLKTHEHFTLCHFIAAMDGRTKAKREHTAKNWGKVVEMIDKMREASKTFTHKQKKQAQRIADSEEHFGAKDSSMSEEDVRQIVTHPMQSTLPNTVIELTPLLFKMNLVVVKTNDSVGFITSDNPCVWIDPEAHKRPQGFQFPALMYESTEIRFPISPKQMLVFTNKSHILNNSYVPIDEEFLNDANRVTRFHSHEFFVVNSNTKKDYWFLKNLK
jgi:hypothetical protein